MSGLDQLREVGMLVRQPAFEEILETRRRRRLRKRVATASALAVAAIAAVGALAVTGHDVRTDPPPVGPSPTPTPTDLFEIPAGQQTITPDIRPGDVHGFDELATVTNSQSEHQGDSELSVTVTSPVDGAHYSLYCRGGSDLFYFWDHGDGGGGYGSCSPDADTSLDPLDNIGGEADGPGGAEGGTESLTVRMWIARPSAAYLDCTHGTTPDCNAEYGIPQPIVNPDAEFGFRIYVHPDARPVLQLFEEAGDGEPNYFEALSSIKGVAWLVDRAVVAMPDADRLAFELPASNTEYLVDVYHASPHFYRCVEQHQDELPDFASTDSHVYWSAADKVCGVELRLVIDGTRIAPDDVYPEKTGHFRELGAHLSPETDHQVEVEVVRGDPRNIRYAVIVRVPTQMP